MMKLFAAAVEEGKAGENGKPSVGPVYRNLLSKNEFPSPDPDISTAWDLFSVSVKKYPDSKMLGWREFVNGKYGGYQWKTYKQANEEVLRIGSALRASGAEPGCRVGVYGANCPEWTVAMEVMCGAAMKSDSTLLLSFFLSFFHMNIIGSDMSFEIVTRLVLPTVWSVYLSMILLIRLIMYAKWGVSAGPNAVNFIIDHAEVDFVFVQDKKVNELLNPSCNAAGRLKAVVCFTSLTNEHKEKAAELGTKPYSWQEFLVMGKENPTEIVPPQPFNICTIMYTSGTSGDPKGVVLTHETVANFVRGMDLFMEQFEDKMTVDDVYLSFLPLAHILDRMIEEYFFSKGASVGYYHGDLNALRDDLMELKPTFLAGVPRVFEKIHEGMQEFLLHKLAWMNMGYKQKYSSPLADLLAFRKVKAKLGGRLRLIVSGGAPLSSEVEEFLRVTCCAFVVQGYGLTETCGPATLGFPDEMCMMGAVGAPAVYNEIRLEEVPDMGYNPLGEPPCGEICVKGKTMFAGYYKNPQLTTESIQDGWFHTGDIGQILPNGVIKVIDRKKNLIKLSQGEYIALEHLENVFGITPIVDDIWVYGDSFKPMLVAVVVLHEENAMKWANANGYKGSFLEICCLEQLRQHVLLELKSTGERNKLRGFEYIKGVILEAKPFDIEKDLVTATLKKKRNKLLKYYQAEIDGLYQKLGAQLGH
ncbi:unnamed protein product [Linum tenue]|uniref:AMP-dependent synthetase/ligase domain-containing protein n=1 Tax=Linum tenue TaxID=586396 RepID=A0AAV0J8N2_9ROSI|nr:unnamed protein product [Linum tenue]